MPDRIGLIIGNPSNGLAGHPGWLTFIRYRPANFSALPFSGLMG